MVTASNGFSLVPSPPGPATERPPPWAECVAEPLAGGSSQSPSLPREAAQINPPEIHSKSENGPVEIVISMG